ncbi:hypothetical protein NDU88_003174 [Pleurodeles waltl]|uniref:Uncharacterized protein n=1 Tax=Pleurodeles waltl TaxID=8319 RepID=A0AAV7QEZ1_PLEWA|nr:hypothetical protein NDU88_003174 [Pleurodeles waltl]
MPRLGAGRDTSHKRKPAPEPLAPGKDSVMRRIYLKEMKRRHPPRDHRALLHCHSPGPRSGEIIQCMSPVLRTQAAALLLLGPQGHQDRLRSLTPKG